MWFILEFYLGRMVSVFIIYNIQYQGNFLKICWLYIGLGWENFIFDKYEDYDWINYLKGGIVFVDMVNMVSFIYVYEIKSMELGMGLNVQF